MKIDNSLKGVDSVRSRETRPGKDRPADPSSANAGNGDSVELTPTSTRLSALAESLASIADTDVARVESVRLAITEGRYQVNEEAVADALLRGSVEQMRSQGKR